MAGARSLICPPSWPLRRRRRKSADEATNLLERHLDWSVLRAAEVLEQRVVLRHDTMMPLAVVPHGDSTQRPRVGLSFSGRVLPPRADEPPRPRATTAAERSSSEGRPALQPALCARSKAVGVSRSRGRWDVRIMTSHPASTPILDNCQPCHGASRIMSLGAPPRSQKRAVRHRRVEMIDYPGEKVLRR